MTAKDILDLHSRKPSSIPESMTIFDAAKLMNGQNIGYLVVVEEEIVIGAVSERDFVRKAIIHEIDVKTALVSEIMTEELKTVEFDTSLLKCLELMKAGHFRHLPVVDSDDKLLGVIAERDITQILLNKIKN
ncbi:CBS domain-containing protein [Bacteriovoracaceae bacterium]|nr:CBS domain-containing protein [Bacteriovoracaceae bacterium]